MPFRAVGEAVNLNEAIWQSKYSGLRATNLYNLNNDAFPQENPRYREFDDEWKREHTNVTEWRLDQVIEPFPLDMVEGINKLPGTGVRLGEYTCMSGFASSNKLMTD